MAYTPDETESQDAAYTGRPGVTSEPADTMTQARDYREAVKSGELDPFLGRAWTQITISQNRNPDGTFARGFTVTVEFQRPGHGEASG